jgi:formate dehydrogenase subunit beta
MATTWMVKTNGDPLTAIRKILLGIWETSHLDGMLIPRYLAASGGVIPFMAVNPEQVDKADICAPLQIKNATQRFSELARELPSGKYAAVLRPCEGRALETKFTRTSLNTSGWFFIAVDCLACFPKNDIPWRLKESGGVDQLTREMMNFARQGGIAYYRYRSACQECSQPGWEGAHLSIEFLGLPIKDYLLVTARDSEAENCIAQFAVSPATPSAITARQRTLEKIEIRRLSARRRRIANLQEGFPATIPEFITWLENCAPCRECLEACPVYSGELALGESSNESREAAVKYWLNGCVDCGMCEEACLRGFPLTAIINRMEDQLVLG